MRRLAFPAAIAAALGLAAAALAGCSQQAEVKPAQTASAPAGVPKTDETAPPPAPNAPKVTPAAWDQMPGPIPRPYDDAAPPQAVMAAIDQAFAKARAEDKRVIVDLGGNWCSWCRGLAAVMALPEVKPFVDANFEVVMVSINSKNGPVERNKEVLARFKMDEVPGVPWLIIAEPDGTILNSSYEVTDEGNETPQAMVNWLARWAKRPAGALAQSSVS